MKPVGGRPPAPRPATPELGPDERVITRLPRGQGYRVSEAEDGTAVLIAQRTRDALLAQARRQVAAGLTR